MKILKFLGIQPSKKLKWKRKNFNFSGSKRTEDLGLVSKGPDEAKYTHSTICNNQNQFWTRKNLIYQEQIQILFSIVYTHGQRIFDFTWGYIWGPKLWFLFKKTLESIEKGQFARYYKITENSSSEKL